MEAKRESRNLGDLLGIKQEDHHHNNASADGGRDKPTSCKRLHVSTASAAVQSKPRRTLLDVLRDNEEQALGNNVRWSLLKNINNIGDVEASQGTVRRSLMALLEENDSQMGLDGYGLAELDKCCVCMVRHKGAAFIPCGHTFCRMCSRELWLQRGNCPLCNNKVLQILDIF